MKILLTHRFFWPDTAPYAAFLPVIGDALAEAGHEVHTFSSIPSYRESSVYSPRRENLGRLNVHRIWVLSREKSHIFKRLANVVLYCAGLFLEVLRQRPHVVTASTFPPVAAAWCASLAARMVGARFVYHIQDIHPEVSIFSGGALGRGLPMRILRWLDNQILMRSSAIIVLSNDMADTLRARHLGELPIHVINNLSMDAGSGETVLPPAEMRKTEGKRRVIFAGNLGRFQRLPLLAEGVSKLFDKHPELELFFLGDGALFAELKARWGAHAQVYFAGFMPFDQARILIEEADIGLVALSAGMYRAAYPSKVLSYAALGVPMLALVESESDLAKALRHAGVGVVPDDDTPEAIALGLDELLRREIAPNKIRAWHDNIAGREKVLMDWCTLVEGLERR